MPYESYGELVCGVVIGTIYFRTIRIFVSASDIGSEARPTLIANMGIVSSAMAAVPILSCFPSGGREKVASS